MSDKPLLKVVEVPVNELTEPDVAADVAHDSPCGRYRSLIQGSCVGHGWWSAKTT